MKNQVKEYISFLKNYRIHFIAWFFFIFYEIVISGFIRGSFASFGNYFLFYFLNVGLFYFHAHVIMPASRPNTKRSLWLLPMLIILEVAFYVSLTIFLADFFQYGGRVSLAAFNNIAIGNGVWRTIYFILFSTGYYYLMNYLKERKIAQESEKQRLLVIIENYNAKEELIKSQHAHLKAQINPHFLFNTLSFIYSHARKTAPEAAEAIMTLSEIMRYAIQADDESNFTSIMLEIEQVENLIKLHQIKAEHKFNILFKYNPKELADIQIIPLVLVTLVENMFKHGDLVLEHLPAIISINLTQQVLIIETQNLINMNANPTSHHIGLDNIKKRLQIVYGQKAFLKTSKGKNNYFNVMLSIDLN